MSSTTSWIVAGATISGLAVVLGAFGAHGLQGRISAERLNTYEIGVKYQMYHGLALLLIAALSEKLDNPLMNYVALGFILGVIIFSGSLYLLVLTDTPWLGAITPIGGLCFIASWALLVYLAVIEGRA